MGWLVVGIAVFGAPRFCICLWKNAVFSRVLAKNRGAPKMAVPTTTRPIPHLTPSELLWRPPESLLRFFFVTLKFFGVSGSVGPLAPHNPRKFPGPPGGQRLSSGSPTPSDDSQNSSSDWHPQKHRNCSKKSLHSHQVAKCKIRSFAAEIAGKSQENR